jgi:small neutral amino acid transporter SnatA (MarC family)
MDFISSIPPSKWRGKVYNALLVIIDRYTKMALYIPVTKRLTAAELADILVERVITRFGILSSIVSDRDIRFTSTF